jgi:DNA-binding phage protein
MTMEIKYSIPKLNVVRFQFKALSPAGNPEFVTILKVVTALCLQLHASPPVVKVAV